MKRMLVIRYGVALFGIVLLLSACAGPEVKDFAQFANSGIHFADQVPKVYDYAFRQEVSADSAKLIGDRERAKKLGTPGTQLGIALKERNELFLERLEQFNTMKRHAALMRGYFVAMARLASGEDAQNAGETMAKIAGQMETLMPTIQAFRVGGKPVSGLFQPVATMAVQALANSYLKKNMEMYGSSVLNAIGLQRGMFTLLHEIEADQDKKAWKIREKLELADLLTNIGTDLPVNWSSQRLTLLTTVSSETPILAAIQSARELEDNLKSLMVNQGGSPDELERSILWINALIEAFEKIQGGTTK